jgi:hypothetical protein
MKFVSGTATVNSMSCSIELNCFAYCTALPLETYTRKTVQQMPRIFIFLTMDWMTLIDSMLPQVCVLGKEAVAAMTAVEAQQQSLTLQLLIALVQYMLCLSIMSWVN